MNLIIVDYGMGNLHSVAKALDRVGATGVVTGDAAAVRAADRLVLPGVGAFADAIQQLRHAGLDEAIVEYLGTGRPFLGICLGLQMLMTTGYEDGVHRGLNVIAGDCSRLTPTPEADGRALRVPHIGWNQVWPTHDVPVLAGIPEGTSFYFVHSYCVRPADRADVAAETDYGGRFCSMVQRGPIVATQFHPEKSQRWGLKLLENWVKNS